MSTPQLVVGPHSSSTLIRADSSFTCDTITLNSFNISGDFNLTSGNSYQIDSTDVLSENTLGIGVTQSSLQTLGTTIQQNLNIASGNDYQISGLSVLDATTLGTGVVNSSLTSVGTLTSLTSTGNINTVSGVYQVGGVQVLDSITLGTGVVNSSLTSVGTLVGVTVNNDMNITTGNDYNIDGTSVLNTNTLGTGVTTSSLQLLGTTILQDLNITSGRSFKINNTDVLTNDTLGVGVTQSSLETVGDLVDLTVVGDLTVDTDTLVVDSANNRVGINQATPLFDLDVVGNTNITGNTFIGGDLTVSGGTTFVSTVNLTVTAPMFKLGTTNPSDVIDIGVYGQYVDSGVTKYQGYFRDASDDTFKFFTGTTHEPTVTVDTTPDTGFTLGDILINKLDTTSLDISTTGLVKDLSVTSSLVVDTDTLYVESSSNRVGINTLAPTSSLHVAGDGLFTSGLSTLGSFLVTGSITNLNSVFRVDNSSNRTSINTISTNLDLALGASSTGFNSENTNEIGIYSSGTEAMRILNTGNINVTNSMGINNSTPAYELDISGDVNTTGSYKINGIDVLTSDTLGIGITQSSLETVGTLSQNLNVTGEYQINGTSVLSSDTLGTGVTQSSLETIGTLAQTLNITGDYQINGTNVLSSDTLGTGVTQSNLQTFGSILSMTIANDLTVDTDTLYVQSSTDRVGINTTAPSFELDVSGDINTTGSYMVDGQQVLNEDTIGTGVTQSSLETVGNLTSLNIVGDLTVDTDTLYVDSTNNFVGIGTTAPQKNLHIVDSDTLEQQVRIENTNVVGKAGIQFLNTGATFTISQDTNTAELINDGGDIRHFARDTGEHRFATTDSDTLRMIITNSGNVGIGHNAPLYSLDVTEGDINTNLGVYRVNGTEVLSETTLGPSVVNIGPINGLSVTGDLTVDRIGVNNSSPVFDIDVTGDINFTGQLFQDGALFVNPDGIWTQDGSGAFLTLGGDVGIGTTNPVVRLNVKEIVSSDSNTSLTLLRMEADSTLDVQNNFGSAIQFLAQRHAIGATFDQLSDGGLIENVLYNGAGSASDEWQFNIKARDSSGLNNVMAIRGDGNVGIGTTVPDTNLHIRGDQGTDGIQLLITPDNTVGQDAGIEIRGHRNASSVVDNAAVFFTNFDNDLLATNTIGKIAGMIENSTTNVGDMIFYNYVDGSVQSETMRLTSTGNVGIGTTNPTEILEVFNSGANAQFAVTREDDTQFKIKCQDTQSRITYEGGNLFIDRDEAETNTMTLDTSGNVGIGTTTPSSALHVNGALDTTPNTKGVHIGYAIDEDRPSIEFAGATDTFIDFTLGDGTDTRGRVYYNHGSDYMTFQTAGDNERMRINSSGNVGIGGDELSTSPAALLHLEQALATGGSGPIELLRLAWNDSNSQDTQAGDGTKISFHTSNVNNNLGTEEGAFIASVKGSNSEANTATHLVFATKSNSTGVTEAMRVSGAGEVGIGTRMFLDIAPSAPLHIAATSSNILKLEQADSGASYISFVNTSTTNDVRVGLQSDEDFAIQVRDANSMWISTSDTQRFIIDSDGMVGLGTFSNPTISLAIGDNDTGLNWASDGNIDLYTNGSARMSFGTSLITATLPVRSSSAGQFLNMEVLTDADLTFTNTTINSSSYQTINSLTYTAVSSSSYIIVEYNVAYDIDGLGGDSFGSRVQVESTILQTQFQQFGDTNGGGTRSGTLFPIMARYTNTSTGSKTIVIEARRVSADDDINIDSVNAFLKITEIAR